MALPRRRTPERDEDRPAGAPGAESSDWHALYEIENPAEVDAYVAEHPIVATVLAEAPDHIAASFEEKLRLILSSEVDPDEPDYPYLTVDIMTKRDADEAYDRLERFDQSWWLDASMHVARADAVIVFYPRFE